MGSKRNVLLLTGLALMVVILAVGPASAEKVFKLGHIGPMTGPSAKVGEEFKGSVQMAMEEIDYTIGDYKIEIIWIDSQSDPAKATNAYSEAVERHGIQATLLNWHSSVAMALMELAAKYKIPEFWGIGNATSVIEKWRSDPQKYGYWGGRGWPDPSKLVQGYIDLLEHTIEKGLWKPPRKLAAIAMEETDAGHDYGRGYREAFKKAGWEIYSEDFFALAQTEFYPLIGKYEAAGVTAVAFMGQPGPVDAAFVKQTKDVGLDAMRIIDGLGWVGEWFDLTGLASNGVLDMIPQLATPAAKRWAKQFNEKYGFKPGPSAGGLSYDGARFWIKTARRALEKHGKLDSESIFDIQFNEVGKGKLTYTADEGAIIMEKYEYSMETMPDPIVKKGYYYFPVIQYKGGKSKIVWPPEWKEAEMSAENY